MKEIKKIYSLNAKLLIIFMMIASKNRDLTSLDKRVRKIIYNVSFKKFELSFYIFILNTTTINKINESIKSIFQEPNHLKWKFSILITLKQFKLKIIWLVHTQTNTNYNKNLIFKHIKIFCIRILAFDWGFYYFGIYSDIYYGYFIVYLALYKN